MIDPTLGLEKISAMKLFREVFRLLRVLIAAGSISLLWSGCATDHSSGSPVSAGETTQHSPSAVTNSPSATTTSTSEPVREILHVGDAVTVSFITLNEYIKLEDHKESIKEDGTITLHLIGPVKAVGKTASELQKEIQDAYVPNFFKRLTVIVKTEGRFYTVGGEVKRPDKFPFFTGLTLLGAIQSAGDFTDFANRHKVQINRTNGQKIMVDCKKVIKDPKKYDVLINPGDVIHVPKGIGLW